MTFDLSIIIVNYNTRDLTLACLTSLFKYHEKLKFEVILVDNKSTDGSVQAIDEKFPQVKIIENKENLGFGKANNLAVSQSQGEFLLFLNSDTKFSTNILDSLLAQTENNTIYGIKLLNKNGTIQPSAGYFPILKRLTKQMLFLDDLPFSHTQKKYQQIQRDFYKQSHNVDWVTGAFLLMPKDLFIKIGGFDEKIFMYGEEVDLCYRAKQSGAKVKYLSNYKIYHFKGASSKNGFRSAVIGEYKGLITFYKKHYPNKIKKLKLILKIGALLRIVIFAIINPDKVKTYLKAYKAI